MIWNDNMIRDWASNGGVTPFDDNMVNPASLDLRLGDELREPHPIWGQMTREEMNEKIADGSIDDLPKWGEPVKFTKYYLMPRGMGNHFVLCSSLEFVNIPNDMAALLFSKSSVGRIGVEHLHAGYGDPGWHDSQWTWEIHNVAPWPIPLVPGKPLMQQVMLRMVGQPARTYAVTGRYNHQSGPTPERKHNTECHQ